MAKKAKKRKRGGGRVATLVNLAAAAAGLVSLARDLMEHRAEAKARDGDDQHRRDERAPHADAPRAEHRQAGGGAGGALRAIDTALDTAQAMLNLNDASPEALRRLSPITKKRARRIVAQRPFKQVKELRRVLPKGAYKAVKRQLTV